MFPASSPPDKLKPAFLQTILRLNVVSVDSFLLLNPTHVSDLKGAVVLCWDSQDSCFDT